MDYVVRMSAQDNISGTVKNAKKAFEELGNTANSAGNKIDKQFDRIMQSTAPLNQKLKGLKKLLSEMEFKGMAGTEQFTKIAQEAGKIKDAMDDASQAVRQFSSDTMKLNAVADSVQVMAGMFSTAVGAVGMLTGENKELQRMMMKVQSAIALVNGVQAIANKLNKDSALMQRIKQIRLEAVRKAQMEANAAEAVGNAETAESTVLTNANNVATAANTAATAANTVKLNAWNTAKAIGKALLGDWTGLLLVGAGALAVFSSSTSDADEEQKKLNQDIDEGAEAQKKYKDAMSGTFSNLMTSYTKLRIEWENLSTVQEKNAWIKENKSKFDELELSVNNLIDAERIFAGNTDAIVEGFVRRAEAAALMSEMEDIFKQKMELMDKREVTLAGVQSSSQRNRTGITARAGAPIPAGAGNYDSKFGVVNGQGVWVFDEKGAKAWNESLGEGAQSVVKIDNAIKEIDNTVSKLTGRIKGLQSGRTFTRTPSSSSSTRTTPSRTGRQTAPNSTNTSTPEEQPDAGSYEANARRIEEIDHKLKFHILLQKEENDLLDERKRLVEKNAQISVKYGWSEAKKKEVEAIEGSINAIDKEIAKIEEDANNGYLLNNSYEETAQRLTELKKAREEIAKRLEITVAPEMGSIDNLKQQIEKNNEIISATTSIEVRLKLIEDNARLQREIDTMTKGKLSIPAEIEPTFISQGSAQDLRASYANANSQANRVKSDYDMGIISYDEAKKRLEKINDRLRELKLKPIEIELEVTGFERLRKDMGEYISSFNGITSGIDSLMKLEETLDNAKSGWDRFMAVVRTAESVWNSVISVIQLVNTITQKQAATKAAETLATQSNTVALTEEAAASAVATVATTALNVAMRQAAIAKAVAAGASTGYPAMLKAIPAAVAAVIASLTAGNAAVQSFSKGGIVQGGVYGNDTVITKLSPSEMVLNPRQQANLFRQINSGFSGNNEGHTITMRVRGTDLYATLHNYGKLKKVKTF